MKKFILIGVIFTVSLYAQDSFGQLNDVFVGWLQGNLGKLLALTGIITIMFTYMTQIIHDGSKFGKALMTMGFIALIAGGIVGISTTFFNMGGTAFTAV